MEKLMTQITDETLTLEEVEKVENALSIIESVRKILASEEIELYGNLTENFLLNEKEISFDTKVMALCNLKTLSHLSKSQDKLIKQYECLPLSKNRDLYYSVPFLAELSGKDNLLGWYKKEAKWVVNLKPKKGHYESLRLLILFYESVIFQVAMQKKHRKAYWTIAEPIFKRILNIFRELNEAHTKGNNNHKWYSTKKLAIDAYKEVAGLWKMIGDVTTVRHANHLPASCRRPMNKLPFEWKELLKIKTSKKVSMININYPLSGLSSTCREIRTYSSFLLHLVSKQRPGFLDSFKNTRVKRHFLNRLRVAYKLEESFPNLPKGIPDKFQREMFLILIEQGVNSLAAKFDLGENPRENLTDRFASFNEQVQAKDEVVLDGPEFDVIEMPEDSKKSEDIFSPENEEKNEDSAEEKDESKEKAAIAQKAEEKDESKEKNAIAQKMDKPGVETEQANEKSEIEPEKTPEMEITPDYPPITNDQEFGMGIQIMPYIFPIGEDQDSIPFEHLPNIKWDAIKWENVVKEASDIRLKTGLTQLFINKLETVETYRYPIFSTNDVIKAKPIKQYRYFVAQGKDGEKDIYYVVKRNKNGDGKILEWTPIDLDENYLKNIEQAYFVILPAPFNHHLFAIPR